MTAPQQPLLPANKALLDNTQGDVLIGFTKLTEKFFLFTIDNAQVPQFRKQLANVLPFVTTSTQAAADRDKVEKNKDKTIDIGQMNIAFSVSGLNKMGFGKTSDSIGDSFFNQGMRNDAQALNDNLDNWLPGFKSSIDGIILVAGSHQKQLEQLLSQVKTILGSSIKEAFSIVGDVREKQFKGSEHFGFEDGISQPAVEGINDTDTSGMGAVSQGIFIVGGKGDSIARPPWAKGGSFLTFRVLAQKVPEFDDFLTRNAIRINDPAAPKDLGKELLGARMFGRWKSGAPLDLTPIKDDQKLAEDSARNNKFTFAGDTPSTTASKCPFSSHIRKTFPRADLSKGALDPHRILRRGIPFGPELTSSETKKSDPTKPRGLLFACYQSNIGQGFHFMQESWCNNPSFIFNKTPTVGVDPIIGQISPLQASAQRTATGLDPNNPSASMSFGTPLQEFVVSKGGEYFFSPSISTLRDVFATKTASKL